MARQPGYVKEPLAIAKHKRTMHLNALDRITKNHVAEMRRREHEIARLTEEIETLERQETK
jgi:hypothetical protein